MGAHDAHQHLVDLIERKNGEEAEEFGLSIFARATST